MLVALGAKHHAAIFEDANQRFVGVLEEQSFHRLHCVDETTIQTNTVQDGQVVRLAHGQVVNAVRGSSVDNARAVFGTDKIGGKDLECIRRIDFEIVEKLLIAHADQRRALNGLRD